MIRLAALGVGSTRGGFFFAAIADLARIKGGSAVWTYSIHGVSLPPQWPGLRSARHHLEQEPTTRIWMRSMDNSICLRQLKSGN